ncbi:MAG: hypothetical protein LYZ70_07160 [Nitrososphaerales archaeon]|nr:hypothetical protein [Nitrososphaerales archaeon]
MPTLLQMIKIPTFLEYSNGRCWTWDGAFSVTSPTSSSLFFVFNRFSDQIVESCGLYPVHRIDTEIYVTPIEANGTVTDVTVEYKGQGSGVTSCPAITQDVYPVSFKLLTWNSTGQTVALTLRFLPTSNVSVTRLEARIYNTTWSYTVDFAHVNQTHPLTAQASVTQTFFIPGSPLRGNLIYNMTVAGTYSDGNPLSSNESVELQT